MLYGTSAVTEGSLGTIGVVVEDQQGGNQGFGECGRVDLHKKRNCCCMCCFNCTQPGNIGEMMVIYGTPTGNSLSRTCIIGPDWVCTAIAMALFIGPGVVWVKLVAFKLHVVMGFFGALILVVTVVSFALTSFSDPGMVLKQPVLKENSSTDGLLACTRCNIYRKPGTIHCSECDICIEGLDHHCPWTGKCIGRKNILYFRVFLGMVCVFLIAVVASVIVYGSVEM
mmetsp:Transcript_4561/g.6795  ORF Transcript_4561/g.6795 Transcript_4561/m.6795 type:complete len:226 (+) Transcript_4561:344-1021(+)